MDILGPFRVGSGSIQLLNPCQKPSFPPRQSIFFPFLDGLGGVVALEYDESPIWVRIENMSVHIVLSGWVVGIATYFTIWILVNTSTSQDRNRILYKKGWDAVLSINEDNIVMTSQGLLTIPMAATMTPWILALRSTKPRRNSPGRWAAPDVMITM